MLMGGDIIEYQSIRALIKPKRVGSEIFYSWWRPPGSAGCIDLVGNMDVFAGCLKQEVKLAGIERIPLYVNNQYDQPAREAI